MGRSPSGEIAIDGFADTLLGSIPGLRKQGRAAAVRPFHLVFDPMRAPSCDSLELPSSNPARAKTTQFSNHVLATTSRSLEFSNHLNTGEDNDNFDPTDDYWVRTVKTATAISQWEDSWLATKTEHVSLDFALEGSISVNQGCLAAGSCLPIIPSGTEFHRTEDFNFDLRAAMVVYDLSTLVPCEQVSDECDGEGDAPLALDSITVRGGIYSASRSADDAVLEAGGTLDVDIVDTLEFDAIAGHGYYVVSLLSVESHNGVRLDFFNSFKLTGVNASPGNLLSSALGDQDITSHFSAVPLPGTLWMMLGGLSLLGLRGARPLRPHEVTRLRGRLKRASTANLLAISPARVTLIFNAAEVSTPRVVAIRHCCPRPRMSC